MNILVLCAASGETSHTDRDPWMKGARTSNSKITKVKGMPTSEDCIQEAHVIAIETRSKRASTASRRRKSQGTATHDTAGFCPEDWILNRLLLRSSGS